MFDPRIEKIMFRKNNIYVLASKFDKLTSHHFKIWLKEVFSKRWS